MAVGWRRQSLEIVRRLARNDGRDRVGNTNSKSSDTESYALDGEGRRQSAYPPQNIVDNITSKERVTGNSRPYTLDRLARASVQMSTLDRPLIDGKKVQRRRPDPAGLHPHPAFLAWLFVHTRQPVSTVEARVAPTPTTRRRSLTTSVILLYVNV